MVPTSNTRSPTSSRVSKRSSRACRHPKSRSSSPKRPQLSRATRSGTTSRDSSSTRHEGASGPQRPPRSRSSLASSEVVGAQQVRHLRQKLVAHNEADDEAQNEDRDRDPERAESAVGAALHDDRAADHVDQKAVARDEGQGPVERLGQAAGDEG